MKNTNDNPFKLGDFKEYLVKRIGRIDGISIPETMEAIAHEAGKRLGRAVTNYEIIHTYEQIEDSLRSSNTAIFDQFGVNYRRLSRTGVNQPIRIAFLKQYCFSENKPASFYKDCIEAVITEGLPDDDLLLRIIDNMPEITPTSDDVNVIGDETKNMSQDHLLRFMVMKNVDVKVLRRYLHKSPKILRKDFYRLVIENAPENSPIIEEICAYDMHGVSDVVARQYGNPQKRYRADVFLTLGSRLKSGVHIPKKLENAEYLINVLWAYNISEKTRQECFKKLEKAYGGRKNAIAKIRQLIASERYGESSVDIIHTWFKVYRKASPEHLKFSLEVLVGTNVLQAYNVIKKGPEIIRAYIEASEVVTSDFLEQAVNLSIDAELVVELIKHSNYQEVMSCKLTNLSGFSQYSEADKEKIEAAVNAYRWYHAVKFYMVDAIAKVWKVLFSDFVMSFVIAIGLMMIGINPSIVAYIALCDKLIPYLVMPMPGQVTTPIVRIFYHAYMLFYQLSGRGFAIATAEERQIVKSLKNKKVPDEKKFSAVDFFDEEPILTNNPNELIHRA